MSTINIDLAGNWIHTAWRSLPSRNAGLPWDHAAKEALNALEGVKTSKLFDRSLKESTAKFHEATRATHLWQPPNSKSNHDRALSEETRDHRLNLTVILLSASIGKSDQESLPERNTINLEHWMSTELDWFWNDREGKRNFNIHDSSEKIARNTLENAWHNLTNNKVTNSNKDGYWSENSLRWENTTICAMDAAYSTVSKFEEARDLTKFREICEKTHQLMIKHKLWGIDSKNPDRANPDGGAKPFDELSKEMKENYVVIVLAVLNGLSEKMKIKQAETQTAAT